MTSLHLDTGRVIPVNLSVDVDTLSRAVSAYSRMLANPDRVFDQGWTMTVDLSNVVTVLTRADLNALVRSRTEPSLHLAIDDPNGGPSQMLRYVIAYSFGTGDPERVHVEPSRGLARVRTAHGEVMLSEQHDLPTLRRWLIDNVLVTNSLVGERVNRIVPLDLPGAGLVEFTASQMIEMAHALGSALEASSPVSREAPARPDPLRRMWLDGDSLLPNGNRWVWRAASRSQIVDDAGTCPMCSVAATNGARQGMAATECNACGQRIQIMDATVVRRQLRPSPETGEGPRSQHPAGVAVDFTVPTGGEFTATRFTPGPALPDHQAIDIWRARPESTGDMFVLPSHNGTVTLSRDHDIVNLRAWLIDNASTNYMDDELIVVPLPSGDITFTARQIRSMAEMLATALVMDTEHRDAMPTDYPGQPLRAVTNIDGSDYVQRDGESSPEFEQRVIRDIVLRRSREMMRDHNMTAEQAATAVQSILDRAGVEGLASPTTRPAGPAHDTLMRMREMTEDEHRLLAGAVDQWHTTQRLPEPVAALMGRLGMTSANMVWMNEQARFGMDSLPQRELRSVMEPTLMETWRD